ncbi:MAG: hypothetical protein ASARMPRED_000874 [Alectoria sarmentosa]|nr:MAG: hypothetical protein ASARMPRED_000874 [Alectoria sarmentosa]
MGRPKRNLLATAAETSSPPPVLDDGHSIALVKKAEGNNLYSVELPSGKEPLLVELPSRFRSQIWIKRGGYVLVDRSAFDDRENKLGGEIVNVVRDEKQWRKQAYWSVFGSSKSLALLTHQWRPPEFVRKPTYLDDSENDESTAGKMPPAEESDSGE